MQPNLKTVASAQGTTSLNSQTANPQMNQQQRPGTSGVMVRSGAVSSSQAIVGRANGAGKSSQPGSQNIFKIKDHANQQFNRVSISHNKNTGSSNEKQGFNQMNNNFMLINGGQSQGNAQQTNGNTQSQSGIHSGAGGVAMGQKTAYGFVGGINGQGLTTMNQQNTKSGIKNNAQNGMIHIQNQNSAQNSQQIPLNKRVFSANRAVSLNANSTGLNNSQQQYSMQHRRRQQAVYQNQATAKPVGNFVNKNAMSHGPASSAQFQGGNSLGASQNFQRKHLNQGNAKYQDDEGFMRGARIAEKIQEYYHSNQTQGNIQSSMTAPNQSGYKNQSGQNSIYNQNPGSSNIIKQYVGNKHLKQSKGGIFQINNFKTAQQQPNSLGTRNTHTSHGPGQRNQQNFQAKKDPNQNFNSASAAAAQQTDMQALKGRASSSYGSLQSRTNVKVSNGSIIKNQPQNLNKSGVSATTGIMNQSNYNSVGGSNQGGIRYYQDIQGQKLNDPNIRFEKAMTQGSQNNLNNTVVSVPGSSGIALSGSSAIHNGKSNSLRPISRDLKIRSQANRNNHSNIQISQTSGQVMQQSNPNNSRLGGKNLQSKQNNYSQNYITHNDGGEAGGMQNMTALSGGNETVNMHGMQATFQNTINIGSFINDINNQQNQQMSANHLMSGNLAKEHIGITTFSNTIENMDDSQEDDHTTSPDQHHHDGQGTDGPIKITKVNSILNTGSQASVLDDINNGSTPENLQTKAAKAQYLTSTATVATNGTLSGGAGVYKVGSAVGMRNKSDAKLAQMNTSSGEEQNAAYNSGITQKPFQETAKTAQMMYIQDGSQGQQVISTPLDSGDTNINRTDEPVIKIQNQNDQVQLENNAASNPAIPNSDIRQIKLNYIQLNKRATTANSSVGINGQRKIPQKAQGQIDAGKFEAKKMTATSSNVYQDQAINLSNANMGAATNQFRKTMQNIGTSDPSGVYEATSPQIGSQNIQNQYRHLQTRQTRRIINAGPESQNAKSKEVHPRGQQYVQQHIQQQNTQAAKMAQTHALAYHVEKYKDGPANEERDNTHHQTSVDAQNQFCTDGSNIENIDNYIIGKRIGQGAYAVVRVGLHKTLNQKIAVKIYEKFKLLEPNRRKSVKREIKIMEKVDHECLAKLYEGFESHKQVFLVMEYVNGGSLHGYLKGKPNRQMAEIEAKFLWQQVVFGIHYLHQRNVTHRDIKLENILLDETRTRVKLIDFGFSTCIPHEKKVKIFCGTPSYMAPEIVSKIEYAGPPADVWALGILLFALLCGRFPFKGQNDKELYTNICRQDLPQADHISRQAKQLLQKIFQKNPDKRPSCKDILRDPWLQFTARDQEMMSPKSLAFIQYLKKISGINFGGNNSQSNKFGMTMQGYNRGGMSGFSNGFDDLQGGGSTKDNAVSYFIQSKDKRNQLHGADIKGFILEENNRKHNNMQKKNIHSLSTEIGQSFNTYNQSNQLGSRGVFDGSTRYNLNDTMPVNSGTNLQGVNSLNMVRQSSIENGLKFTSGGLIAGNQGQNIPNPNQIPADRVTENSQKLSNKINMEAYQAYYNTNDGNPAATSTQGGQAIEDKNHYQMQEGQRNQNDERYPADNPQNMKIINNIMHINHSGANINIMCNSDPKNQNEKQQNNFIFNHTAPINLNFYEEIKKKQQMDLQQNNGQMENFKSEKIQQQQINDGVEQQAFQQIQKQTDSLGEEADCAIEEPSPNRSKKGMKAPPTK